MSDSRSGKAETAFRTIGELSRELGLPQHRLRYWESRFPQLRPVQRAGQRRYYRPEDVALVRRINDLINVQGYTIRGVQRVLAGNAAPQPAKRRDRGSELRRIRDRLAAALAADDR
ncbi:MerR family transcriptional regulator [Stakelama saccharophila]|uniref:MerR family transcriptional regulator n=1 Tax=Stakelama saccharophila TaxID=3075605 RepID=A0ABZ0B9S9_9SPHN|nr:MerR family transcriptional regulator [Stakelama sp. W311]WNO53972.1 MerR family transcriptional regulator [Stakelama sp. W311]